jgi:hypothetical protein
MKRVVASLTTMPDRYDKIVKTLTSLNNQTRKLDAIYLGLPEKSKRMGIEYPVPNEEITKLCQIVKCDDYGPITKLMGGLLSEEDPETIIISFDDDYMYPENLVESLLKHNEEYPNSAIGSSGMLLKYECPFCAINPNENSFVFKLAKIKIPDEGRRVDSLYGYPGALYLRKFFPAKENLEKDFLKYALIDNNTFLNDDITISGYLSLHNIERRIFKDIPDVSNVLTKNNQRVRSTNEISYNLPKFFRRMNAAILTCKSIGMYSETEEMNTSETIIGILLIVVISLLSFLIFLILIYFIYKKYLF